MDNTKFNNNVYTCGVCGQTFEKIEDRNIHEAKCLADRKKAEEAFAKKKLEDEKTARKTEIEKKYKELEGLVRKYCKDYGSLQLGETHYFNNDNYLTLPKLLGWWF